MQQNAHPRKSSYLQPLSGIELMLTPEWFRVRYTAA
jgi:hypothetical protein